MKRHFLTLVFMLFASQAIAQAPYLSLEDVVAMKRVTSASISPDNRFVAYTVSVPREVYKDKDGGAFTELHVTDLDGNSRPYITGDVNVSSVRWSADGESLYFLSKRDKDAKFNSLYRIPVAGGEAEKLFTHVSSIGAIYPSPDGEIIAFTATDKAPEKKKELADLGFKAEIYEEALPFTRVWMYDIASGEAALQDIEGNASTFAWDASGERYAVAMAPTPLVDDTYTSRDITVVDADKGKALNKIGSTGKLGDFAFSPDGDRIAYIGSVDIHDPAEGRLYVTSSTGG